MHKLLIGVAAGTMVVFAALAALALYLAHVGSDLDGESRAYAENSLQVITSHWDVQAVLARATPQLKRSVSPEKLAAMFVWFGSLGPLVESHGCNGQATIFKSISGPTQILARYRCLAKYQQGEATIEMALEKSGAAWEINGFHVNSDVLISNRPAIKL